MPLRFQDQLGQALRTFPNTFCFHPADGLSAAQWKPGDFLVCHKGAFYVCEAKQTRTNRFPLTDWTSQQRGFARQVVVAGGCYWLVVNWRGPQGAKTSDGFCRAYRYADLVPVLEVGVKSLTGQESCAVNVPWVNGKWDVAFLFDPHVEQVKPDAVEVEAHP